MLADLTADVASDRLRPVTDGRVEHRLRSAGRHAAWCCGPTRSSAGRRSTRRRTSRVPGKPDQRKAIAIEPMTCAVNAFNTGDGLRWLEPGETWSAHGVCAGRFLTARSRLLAARIDSSPARPNSFTFVAL